MNRNRAGPVSTTYISKEKVWSRHPKEASGSTVSEKRKSETQTDIHKENIMTGKKLQLTGPARTILGALALVVLFAFGAPQAAQASTSANATIFNQVTVSYQSGTNVLTAKKDVSVTVATLAAKPAVYVNTTTQTTTAGGDVTYTYTVRSNSNGPDTYTLTTPVTSTDSNISAPGNSTPTTSIALWGGIVVSSGIGTISLPGGSTTGLAVNDTVELTVGGVTHRYTVSNISAGNAQSDGVAEVLAVVTLTPFTAGTDPAIKGDVAAGTQVGQYKATVTLAQTAGTPSTAGTDGTHVTDLTFTTTATDLSNATLSYTTAAADGNEVTTTVSSPSLEITKVADNTTPKPGETITYTITVKNTHATASVNNVTITDPVPNYTDYVNGSTRLNGITVAGDGATSPLIAGLKIDTDSGRTAGAAASGTLAAGETATITYQVTVQ